MSRHGLGLFLLPALLAACGGQGGARSNETTNPMPSAMPSAMQPPMRGPCDDLLKDIGVPAETKLHNCSTTRADARCLPEADLHRLGFCYSGYRDGQDPRPNIVPSMDEIREDLGILAKRGYTLLRLFDSGEHAVRTLQVIRDDKLDFKVQLGIWIDGPKDGKDERNQADITRGVELAKQYEDIIYGVSVGNETLDTWSSVRTPPADLAGYIKQVRELVTQPVTTDDMYPPYQMRGDYADVKQVVAEIDYISLHIYSFIDAQWSWDYQQVLQPLGPPRAAAMMAAGLEFTKAAVRNVRANVTEAGYDLPILIGEAGWKSVATKAGVSGEQFRAHPLNQAQFYGAFMSWVAGPTRDQDSPEAAQWFAAFDESWKGEDDGWGLFDHLRQPKYALSCSFPDLVPSGPTEYKPEDAVYYHE